MIHVKPPSDTTMKLWLFTFTQPDRLCCSVRVAAPTRQEACALLGSRLNRVLIAQEYTHPEPGTILVFFGKTELSESKVVSFVDLAGNVVDNI